MSGTKFRLSCSSCGATFFSLDRLARYCPKCAKKKGHGSPVKAQPAIRPPEGADARPRRPLLPLQPESKPAPKPKQQPRPPKATEPTPEQRERIAQFYNEHCLNQEFIWKEVVAKLSGEMWLTRGAVSAILNELQRSKVEVTPETKARIIEMYKGYVELGERPAGGRRKTIAITVSVPYSQVRDIVYEYSCSEYAKSPIPDPAREQKFALEKLYWAEMDNPRYGLNEMPAKLAEQSGQTTWQVLRWLDFLHDEEDKFASAPDVEPEIEARILEAYRQYLLAPAPPEQGLHLTIAQQIGGIVPRQVAKVLHRYRHRRRAEYPLK